MAGKSPHRFVVYTGGMLLLACMVVAFGAQAYHQAQSNRALLTAVRHNDLVSVKSAIAGGADVNASNNTSICEMLRSRLGLAPNRSNPARQEHFATTLMLAIDKRDDAALSLILLQHGADTRARNASGETALHLAAQNSDLPMMKALLTYRADVNAQDALGETPLMKAAAEEGNDAVQFLMNHGAQPTQKNNKGETALDKARKIENIQAILVLQQTQNVR